MRPIKRPSQFADEIVELCAASVRDADLAQRLRSVKRKISEHEREYIEGATAGRLYQLATCHDVDGKVTKAEMTRLYDGTFVRSVKTRAIYGGLLKAPKNDICPLCAQRAVSTLDHYLPKAEFPPFAISLLNLVPACSECNKAKRDRIALTAEEQTLHPYFDDVDEDRWLYADIVDADPFGVRYFCRPPDNWSAVTSHRVVAHFKNFSLGALYATHAAVEVNNMRYGLERVFEAEGLDGLREHLRLHAVSCAEAAKNSWQSALYEALWQSDRFCRGFECLRGGE